jgi:hypothetical protein
MDGLAAHNPPFVKPGRMAGGRTNTQTDNLAGQSMSGKQAYALPPSLAVAVRQADRQAGKGSAKGRSPY